VTEFLTRLEIAWRSFQTDWERCQESWQDDVAEKFAEEFIAPWHSVMTGLLVRLKALRAEVGSAQRLSSDGGEL